MGVPKFRVFAGCVRKALVLWVLLMSEELLGGRLVSFRGNVVFSFFFHTTLFLRDERKGSRKKMRAESATEARHESKSARARAGDRAEKKRGKTETERSRRNIVVRGSLSSRAAGGQSGGEKTTTRGFFSCVWSFRAFALVCSLCLGSFGRQFRRHRTC